MYEVLRLCQGNDWFLSEKFYQDDNYFIRKKRVASFEKNKPITIYLLFTYLFIYLFIHLFVY